VSRKKRENGVLREFREVRADALAAAIEKARFPAGNQIGERDYVFGYISHALEKYAFDRGEHPTFGELPGKDDGDHLDGFITAARKLEAHWRGMSFEMKSAMGLPMTRIRATAEGQTVNPANPLRDLLDRAEYIKKARRGGRPKDKPLEDLMHSIVGNWRTAFDLDEKAPYIGIRYRGAAQMRYHGELLDFVEDVLKSQGIRYGLKQALGRDLWKLTDEWGMRTPPPERMPKPQKSKAQKPAPKSGSVLASR
jgi:hypothetical protein